MRSPPGHPAKAWARALLTQYPLAGAIASGDALSLRLSTVPSLRRLTAGRPSTPKSEPGTSEAARAEIQAAIAAIPEVRLPTCSFHRSRSSPPTVRSCLLFPSPSAAVAHSRVLRLQDQEELRWQAATAILAAAGAHMPARVVEFRLRICTPADTRSIFEIPLDKQPCRSGRPS